MAHGNTIILDREVPRTLDRLIATLRAQPPEGAVEAWVFDDEPARKGAESALAAAGIQARIRSAYKPLVHFFLEEVDLAGVRRIEVAYPLHPAAHPERFVLEAYPLAGLVGGIELVFAPGAQDLTYDVTLIDASGASVSQRVFAPNILTEDHLGKPTLRCCGWLRAGATNSHFATDFEALYLSAIAAVKRREWPREEQPYFDRLRVLVELFPEDRRLGFHAETSSLREAMHEDLVFSLRECLNVGLGDSPDPPGASPGQIVPDIRPAKSAPRIVMTLESFSEHQESTGPDVPIAVADRPLKMGQIRRELEQIEGTPLEALSREGREVLGRYKKGVNPAVLISSGQHANETSGAVGALRAARILAQDPRSHFAIVPVENVDGYELHQRLMAQTPLHALHAARYTAVGDNLFFTSSPITHEREARTQALALSSAKLHLNLHGYASHEWTRPMSGYLARGQESWMMPKGFYLILCAHPGWEATGEALLERVARRLSTDKGLIEFNARQIACTRAHTSELPFEVRHGIACSTYVETFSQAPLTLVTEAPDETVYGRDYINCHEAHMKTVLYAVEAFVELMHKA